MHREEKQVSRIIAVSWKKTWGKKKKKRNLYKKTKKNERVTCSVGNLNVKAEEQNTATGTAFSVNGREVRLEGVQVILLTISFPKSI